MPIWLLDLMDMIARLGMHFGDRKSRHG